MTTLQTATPRPTALAALVRAVGWFLAQLAVAGPRVDAIERLSRLSDAELARRGTTREAEIRRILGGSAAP
jgi:hypothetical protein